MQSTAVLSRAVLGISLYVLISAPVMAEEIVCQGSLGDATVDNLRVPPNTVCQLNKTRVMGNIKVEANATLTASRIIVAGNVQGENAGQVSILNGSRVVGSVQVKQGGGATVSDSVIDSDIQYDENATPLKVLRNIVGGNVQVEKNRGGVEITGNTIDGNLQCKENSPSPLGGDNIVQGNKEDQCRQLSPAIAEKECTQSQPFVTEDTGFGLHIPRVSVTSAGRTDVYEATLRYAPDLSRTGSLVFEVTHLGPCNQ